MSGIVCEFDLHRTAKKQEVKGTDHRGMIKIPQEMAGPHGPAVR